MRKTKIVCTLGPATDKGTVLEDLIVAGMDVARFNFSHSTYDEHGSRMRKLQELREKHGRSVASLLDTKGPEIRVKNFRDGSVFLKKGQEFSLFCTEREGDENGVSITYGDLYKDVKEGTFILLDDGLIGMSVEQVDHNKIVCRVQNDGKISNYKGINVPGIYLSLPYMSEKDRSDILFGIQNDFDFVAASFVRNAEDIMEIRHFLDKNGGENINIIAKIENQQGVNNVDDIIRLSDGIMIARGDMGVEIPTEEVPVIQKMIIKKVYQAGKQVITATQMLDSMMQHPRPTRAEVTDVANAIYDGTSAIMLSGETAAGLYPIESLSTMVKIAERTEADIDYRKRFFNRERRANPNITDAISHATCTTAHDLNAKAIITVTKSGTSARMISRYRPECDIVGCSTDSKVCRQINMSWGVTPALIPEMTDVFELFHYAVEASKEQAGLKSGDITVLTSGVPIGIPGTTNMLKVEIIE